MQDTLIAAKAHLGQNVKVGFGTRIGPNVVIEDNCTIGDHCTIGQEAGGAWAGRPLRLGAGSVIRSHTVLYEGSELGPDLQTGHHVLIREGTRVGPNLRIGSYSDIEGDCVIGDCARFHGYAHVGRRSRLGHFVHLYSLTILLNDPLPPSEVLEPVTLEDGVVVAVGAMVMPGTVMRCGSFAAARAVVAGEVPPGAVVEGPQGRLATHVTYLANFQHGIRHPWMRNFAGRYPEWAQARLKTLEEQIIEGRTEFIHLHKPV
jgi:acetyltransferase-like isoleucine patch superfamily enzyme